MSDRKDRTIRACDCAESVRLSDWLVDCNQSTTIINIDRLLRIEKAARDAYEVVAGSAYALSGIAVDRKAHTAVSLAALGKIFAALEGDGSE